MNYKIQKNPEGPLVDYSQLNTDPDEEMVRWCERMSNNIVKVLGKGRRENLYHKAFEVELKNNHIPYESEVVLPIMYKGQQISYGKADIIINRSLILEFKAIKKKLDSDEICQIKNYMESSGIRKGMVINFGRTSGINNSNTDFIYVNQEGMVYPV
jgi:GxxExxY protein